MATPKAAWGIEIGAAAIKAIRLERQPGTDDVRVSDFAVIPYKKVLTTPDLDQDEMVRLGLGQFISQKNLEGEHLVMSVPGHSAFARFAKLPPVEPKKVPDIVKFEAVQQIPFPIDEVEWDYQTFTSEDTPEIEVGIFAITRERVQQRLGLYAELGLSPETLTLSPVAVYNAMVYDHGGQNKGPIVYLDIGTNATDVIIAEAGRCWIRTFPLGGTHFTEAIASAFKLSYSKAEKLKLEASESKYAKQIMQAMRPVFSDLLQDLQRSIGYYQTLHRDSQLTTMVGIGSTFKIPGLRKFLGQQLQIEVARLDEYKRIAVTGREAASFAENAVNMATAYGLALQGIGAAQINANLVPVKTLRDQMWQSKTKWFGAAAAIVVLGSGMMLWRPLVDGTRLKPLPAPEVANVITRGNDLRQRYEALRSSSDVGATATNMLSLLDQRKIWPYLLNDVATALASTNPQPALLGSKPELIISIDPKVRKLVQLNELTGDYVPPVQGQSKRRIRVTLNVELSHDRPNEFLNSTVEAWLRANAEPAGQRAGVPYRILASTISTNPSSREEVAVAGDGEEKVVVQGNSNPKGSGVQTPQDPVSATPPGGSRSNPGGVREVGAPLDAPGSSGLGFSSPGATAPPTSIDDTNRRGDTDSPAEPKSAQSIEDLKQLNDIAPIPPRPAIYPPNSMFYRIPITFEIELLDSATPAPITADSGRSEGAAS